MTSALMIASLRATIAATASRAPAARARPLHARVLGAAGGAARFRAVATGGAVLVIPVGSAGGTPAVTPLAPGDTLGARPRQSTQSTCGAARSRSSPPDWRAST
jgi:hypothetical protein